MKNNTLIIENVKKWPRHAGKNDFMNFLAGKHLTRNQAIRATCYECVGGEDTSPCTIPNCSLTLYCPWNKKGHNVT